MHAWPLHATLRELGTSYIQHAMRISVLKAKQCNLKDNTSEIFATNIIFPASQSIALDSILHWNLKYWVNCRLKTIELSVISWFHKMNYQLKLHQSWILMRFFGVSDRNNVKSPQNAELNTSCCIPDSPPKPRQVYRKLGKWSILRKREMKRVLICITLN